MNAHNRSRPAARRLFRAPARMAPLIGRLLMLLVLAMAPAVLWGALETGSSSHSWEQRLRGDSIVLLGEVHDNPMLQSLRFEVLKRAIEAGWRPAIAMEQFDREHQADIDQARLLRPLDADYLIERAAPHRGSRTVGWNWNYYRRYVALALQYRLPLLAANLSTADAEKIVSHGYAAVFDPGSLSALGLDRVPPTLQSSQESEVDEGHCHLLPEHLLPGMTEAQLARDALMAAILKMHAANGVVLLAGNGHVRRDLGVPQWLGVSLRPRALSVGFVERGTPLPAAAFDAVVPASPAQRDDPCVGLQRSLHRP